MWKPISLEELHFEIQKTEPELKDGLLIFWEQIKIEPEKWQEPLYGNEGGGFWVVAIFREKVIWYNDIEEGFNISDYGTPGNILEYGAEQDELKWCLNKLIELNKLNKTHLSHGFCESMAVGDKQHNKIFDIQMKGVLLVNLGSPDSPEPKDVKPYLDEFLMDKYVIDVPYLLRALLVRGIILRKRPEASAEAYKKIWWEEGSPLIVLSERMHKKVQKKTELPVSLAMRYGKPSIETGLQELADQGVTEVLLFPLYPQYAMASTLTILVLAEEIRKKKFPQMTFTDVPAFYNKPDYITALANSIKSSLQGFDYDHLLFSYHGIPERHIRKTDVTKSHCKIDSSCCTTPSAAHKFCYRHQCYETTRLVVEQLGIPKEKYSLTFQSRLAGDKWLEPYTDVEINKMPPKGIKKLAVVTPAFVADCLETLEEIAMRAKEEFEEHGGEKFLAVPCLNDSEEWTGVAANWINEWAHAETPVV